MEHRKEEVFTPEFMKILADRYLNYNTVRERIKKLYPTIVKELLKNNTINIIPNETEYKTYVDGLKDLGGALEFTFNLTQELVTAWDALMTAYETAKEGSKAIWFAIVIPGLEEAFAFTGNPSAMGVPAAEVSSVLEITNRITPTGAPQKVAKTKIKAN